MAIRYSGDVKIYIVYVNDRTYRGYVAFENIKFRFADLQAPACGLGRGVAYDSPAAYDEMARAAVGFATHAESDVAVDGWLSADDAETIGNNANMGESDYVITRKRI